MVRGIEKFKEYFTGYDMSDFCQKVSLSLPDHAFFKAIGVPVKPKDVFGLLCRAFQV